MPEFTYIGTVTFDPEYSLDTKWKRIAELPEHLCHHFGTDIWITYSIEYHKVEGELDPEAPHVHFSIKTHKKCGTIRARAINEYLKERHGRSQFYLATQLKAKQWQKYIQKEIKDSNKLVPDKIHYYEHVFYEYLGVLQKFKHKPEYYNDPYL